MSIWDILLGRNRHERVEIEPEAESYSDAPHRKPQSKFNTKDETGFYPIICPHCLESFKIWEAEFRAYADMSGTGIGEANTGDFESLVAVASGSAVEDENATSFPAEIDKKFDDFERKYGGAIGMAQGKILRLFDEDGIPTGEVESITLMNPATGSFGKTFALKDYYQEDSAICKKPIYSVVDKFGNNFTERVCPHCHHIVSNMVGIYPSYTIGVVGNTMCGKTVYIEALCGALSRGILFGDRITGLPAEGEDWSIRLKRSRKKAEKGEIMLEGTSIGFMPPNILLCARARSGKHFILNLFDFPGEAIKNGQSAQKFKAQYQQKIPKINAWMFLFDSASFDTVRIALNDEKKREYVSPSIQKDADGNYTPSAILNSFVGCYLQSPKFTTPVAFVVTKVDLVELVKDKIMENAPGCMFPNPTFLNVNRNDPLYQANVDLDDINACSDELLQLFNHPDYQDDKLMVHSAKDSVEGERAAWFGVSSTGVPIKEGEEAKIGQPRRVTEPLQWLLWMLGAIEGEGSNYPKEWDN